MRRLIVHPVFQISLGLLALILVQYNWLLLQVAVSLHGNDFGKFYYAAVRWRSGASLYDSTIATRMLVEGTWMEFPNLNPPHFHLLLLPFIFWSLPTATILWTGANAAAGLCAGAIVIRALRIRVLAWQILPAACVILLSSATGAILLTGQYTGLLLLPITIAWRAARQGHWSVCGAVLGVLIGVKPFLALFVPALIITGRWRAIWMLLFSVVVCFAVGVLVFGWSPYLEWLATLRSVSWPWATMNASLMAVLSRAFGASPYFTAAVLRPSVVGGLWMAGSLLVGGISLVVARRSIDHMFAAIVLGSLLVSPLGWVYYLWLALPGCLALWSFRAPLGAWLGLAILCVPLFALRWWQPGALATLTIGSSYAWATLALWIAVVSSGSGGRPR
jgi:hypothetical protein